MIYKRIIKPIFDCCFAFILLSLLMPIILVLLFLLFLQNNVSPFFSQSRPGKHGKIFTIYKLKTMRDTRSNSGELLPDKQRTTTIGNIVRKLSLDELPQLWNILQGDMSFVGPRPLLPEYLPLYSKEQEKRHDVKPGITGWAQVNGRNTISWKQKFDYDLWYIQHQSFILDIKILCMTLTEVFKTKDINATEQITMEPFNGNS
jgi:undecaprenyl phosphate N,N'-diacetylbacillosamine 1-phosphate transferase|tara:strand:+ start:620 stop:1228 length:609 start_codon:yes stop_codon:yes gene_type:complete